MAASAGATQAIGDVRERQGPGMVRWALLMLAAGLMLADLVLIFLWVPTEQTLGIVQRVFYFHVPSAWVGFLAFFMVFIASIGYLWRRKESWDAMAQASAEIGVMFTTLMLVTGIIWAKPIWGVWWTWDPRLTLSLILWLIYVAYLMVRAYAPSRVQGARYSAVVGILGFVDVPIVYFSIRWWRTIHPQAMVGPGAEPGGLASSMLFTLLFSVATFTLLFVALLLARLSLRRAEDGVEIVRGSVYR